MGIQGTGVYEEKIAETMGLSISSVTNHLNNAERRFREYARYHAVEEQNNEPMQITLTRGEVKLIVSALSEYGMKMLHDAHFNVKTDWRGRLPYEAQRLVLLSERLQKLVYGTVLYQSMLSEVTEDNTSRA